MSALKAGDRITVPAQNGDALATVLAVDGLVAYINWDHDGADVVDHALVEDVRRVR